MYKIVEMSHILIKEYLSRNYHKKLTLVDATSGMGNDSLFISKLLNKKSKLYCYDIQVDAIINTNQLLLNNNINNVTLFLDSHENITIKNIDLVIFNLGYLPTKDKKITTTSLVTLNTVNKLLNNNPNITIILVVYPGHEEGLKESVLLEDFVLNLEANKYLVSKYQNYNQNKSPYILTISKKGSI